MHFAQSLISVAACYDIPMPKLRLISSFSFSITVYHKGLFWLTEIFGEKRNPLSPPSWHIESKLT